MNAERIRRAIRAHPALWGELGPAKEEQAQRILKRTADRLRPTWDARADAVRHAHGQRALYTWA